MARSPFAHCKKKHTWTKKLNRKFKPYRKFKPCRVLITIILLTPRKGTKIKVWNLTDGLDAYTALYRRRQTMAGDPVLELFQTIYQEETKLQ